MMLDDTFQGAVHAIANGLSNRAFPSTRANQIAEAFRKLNGILVCLEAAIVQTCLPIVREVLEYHKATTGEFDHDDQIKGVALTLDGCHGDGLIQAMQCRYRFALIDEFQDTDELQWSFFERVFLESTGRNIVYLIVCVR
jgi:exodeoxyribonuclease V beta subunit